MPISLVAVSILSVAGLIAVLSLLPGDARMIVVMPSWLQLLGHLACYAIFGFLCALGLASTALTLPVVVLAAFFVATLFGVIMELLQRYRPGRSPSFGDALIDALGAALGALIAAAFL